jgi:hypothetical protein
MKLSLLISFFLASFYSEGQIVIRAAYLTSYCRNHIDLDDRYYIDSADNPFFEILTSHSSKFAYTTRYTLIPFMSGRTTNLIVRRIVDSVEIPMTCYLREPSIQLFKLFPTIEGRYDCSLGVENLKYHIRTVGSRHDGDGTNMGFYNSNKFDLLDAPMMDNQSSIQDYILKNRPDSIRITNVTFDSERYRITSDDTLTLKLCFPKEKDPSKWCGRTERDTLTLDENFFKESEPDTLKIVAHKCLYIRFDSGGTENDFLIKSLEYDRELYIREFCCGEQIPLFNATEDHGLFHISFLGDGGQGNLYILLE